MIMLETCWRRSPPAPESVCDQMDQLGSDIAEPRAAAAPAAKALLAVLRGVQDFLFETSEIRGCDLKTFFIDDVLRFLVR